MTRKWVARSFKVDDDTWSRFGDAVHSTNPDLDRADALRALIRWYLDDSTKLMIAFPVPKERSNV